MEKIKAERDNLKNIESQNLQDKLEALKNKFK
jgi:hypothetical protein